MIDIASSVFSASPGGRSWAKAGGIIGYWGRDQRPQRTGAVRPVRGCAIVRAGVCSVGREGHKFTRPQGAECAPPRCARAVAQV